MTEFEWEQKASRKEVAELLKHLAAGLSSGGQVALARDSWELKLEVPNELQLEVELEIGDGETELEIELKWSSAGGGGARRKQAAGRK